MSYHGKARAIQKGGFPAKYNGKCPYPHCQKGGKISASEDWIVKGKLGYGHVECVNTKVHFIGVSGSQSLCKTTQLQRIVDDWDEVNCKKCLKLKSKMGLIQDSEIVSDFVRDSYLGYLSCIQDGGVTTSEDLMTHWANKFETEFAKLTESQAEIFKIIEKFAKDQAEKVKDMNDDELEKEWKRVRGINLKEISTYIRQVTESVIYVVTNAEDKKRAFQELKK